MSESLVDDMHAAEDYIGTLEHALSTLLDAPLMPPLDKVPVTDDEIAYETAVRDARLAVMEPWCRPSCSDHDWECSECGDEIKRHPGGEYEHVSDLTNCIAAQPCDELDLCGCPCHNRGETGANG